MTPAKYTLLAAKLLVTAVLLWMLFDKIEFGPLVNRMRHLQPAWVLTAIVTTFTQLLLTAVRWHYVSVLLSAPVAIRQAVRLVLIGQFFNQVLPSSIGGDGVRAWLLARMGMPVRRALSSILCDRIAALVVLGSMVAIALPLVRHLPLPTVDVLAVVVPIVAVASVSGLLVFGGHASAILSRLRFTRPIGALVRDARIVMFTRGISSRIVGLAVLVQLLGIAIVNLCARSIGVDVSVIAWFLIPVILLVSMIPISFAGWGVRESAMVVGLGAAGVASHDALAVSVLYGLTQIVVGLPGSVIFGASRQRRGGWEMSNDVSAAATEEAARPSQIQTQSGDDPR